MPIKVLSLRKLVCKPLVWYIFLLLFFHKNNLGTGLLECIISSVKWKYYYISLLFGHTVINRIFITKKIFIIIYYNNIFLIGFLAEIFIFQSHLSIFFVNQSYRKKLFLPRPFTDLQTLCKLRFCE